MKNIKDDKGFNQVWAEGEATRIRAERRCNLMVSALNTDASKTILEIGCGTGKNAYLLAKKTNAKVIGSDICVPFIEQARQDYQLPNLEYLVVDIHSPEELLYTSFDHIVGNGILHHLYSSLEKNLNGTYNMLNTGGNIVFWEPNVYNPYIFSIFKFPPLRHYAHLEPDEMAFTPKFIRDTLKNVGFKNIRVEFRDFLLPGIPEAAIKPSIRLGNILERTSGAKALAQSLFIVAEK